MTKQVIVIRKDLNMRKGKIAAQCSHASIAFITKGLTHEYSDKKDTEFPHTYSINLSDVEVDWLNNSFTKICVYVNSEQELKDLIRQAEELNLTCHPIVDNGKTEFSGVPTLTCCAFGPDESEKIDKVTGHLPLL